jgi:radical SAM superfamily enzyme YgiQ (UPF0313 family)
MKFKTNKTLATKNFFPSIDSLTLTDAMLPPDQILIRPPVEAYSVLIAVTGGCSWNRCRFCGVYKGIQDYHVRPLEDILEDIKSHSKYYPDARWVYLAGGNPTSTPTDFLMKIITAVKDNFPQVERISSYAKILDIARKSDEELKALANAGLTIVYVGLESGSDKVLANMKKGTTARMAIQHGKRVLVAGIKISFYIILGLGSYELSEEHARGTAQVLTEVNPTIFRFRTLNLIRNSPLYQDYLDGKFKVLRPVDVIREERAIIAQLGPNVTSEVYNDHISNYVDIHSHNIQRDRQAFLQVLDDAIQDPRIQKLEPRFLEYM